MILELMLENSDVCWLVASGVCFEMFSLVKALYQIDPNWLEAGGSAGSYFGGGQAWLGNIAIQDIQKKKSRDK